MFVTALALLCAASPPLSRPHRAPPPQTRTAHRARRFRIPSGTQFVYFAALIGGAALFYSLALFVFLPILILSPSKFALCFSFGSVCTMAALVMLSGWQASLRHLLAAEKLPFTAGYAGSLFATLYAALAMHSYLLCIVFSLSQVRRAAVRSVLV